MKKKYFFCFEEIKYKIYFDMDGLLQTFYFERYWKLYIRSYWNAAVENHTVYCLKWIDSNVKDKYFLL